MTNRSSLQNVSPAIHPADCRCKRCKPIKLAGDSMDFYGAKGWGKYLPDTPYAVAMLIIGTAALTIHIAIF
jgi:hypothetical protein